MWEEKNKNLFFNSNLIQYLTNTEKSFHLIYWFFFHLNYSIKWEKIINYFNTSI